MTLTEAAFWFKRFSKIAIGVALVAMLGILILWKPREGIVVQKYITPSCACTPKKENFLENELVIPSYEIVDSTVPSYEVQTETGKLDDSLPKIVNVYEYTNLGEQVNAKEQAMILAKKMGFDQDRVKKVDGKAYEWTNTKTKRKLTVTAVDLNFTYETIDKDMVVRLRKTKDLPSTDEAITSATRALNSIGVEIGEYTVIPPTTYRINIEPDGQYTEAESLLEAELIRVDFYRQKSLITVPMNIEGAEGMVASLEKRANMGKVTNSILVNDQRVEVTEFTTLVFNDNPNKSNISVYVGVEDSSLKVLKDIYQIDFKTWSISPQSCGTYPLISADVAEEKVKNGQGSLVFLNYDKDQVAPYAPQEIKRFLITSVSLIYYEGSNVQQYLQPVYFFSGVAELKNSDKADFHIYYPAIDYTNVTDEIEIQEVPVEEKGGLFPSS